MKKYIIPEALTLQAQMRQMVCASPESITISRDSDKEVTTSWVRQQELWSEEEGL